MRTIVPLASSTKPTTVKISHDGLLSSADRNTRGIHHVNMITAMHHPVVTCRCERRQQNRDTTASGQAEQDPTFLPNPLLDDDELELPTWVYSPSTDPFASIGDRCPDQPLPLPRLPAGSRRRVVLVRHGQSTWNARNRIQGSSDFSVLTEEGRQQAAAAAATLADWNFDSLFHSPLQRATETASIIWNTPQHQGPTHVLPVLREIDLYSFQGMNKASGRATRPQEYAAWQTRPAEFQVDGHWPVKELWYRASLAWQDILTSKSMKDCGLVVAHNAVNQAMVATALGLPPIYFRRLTQTNAAFSVVEFTWKKKSIQPHAIVRHFNHFSDSNLAVNKSRATERLVLVTSGTSKAVEAALRVLAQSGIDSVPLVSVGSSEAQAADTLTALEATLATAQPPTGGRSVMSVVSPEACHLILDACLGVKGIGKSFEMSPGGVSIINYLRNANKVEQGAILCTNFDAARALP